MDRFLKCTPLLLLIAIAVTVLGIMSCGGDAEQSSSNEDPATTTAGEDLEAETAAGSVPEPTLAPTNEPTRTPEPTPSPTPLMRASESELDFTDISTTTQLSSYRSKMIIIMEGTSDGQEVKGLVELLTEYSVDPLAQYIQVSGEGTEQFETSSVEMYRVEDSAFMKLDGEWLSLSVSESGDDLLVDAGILGPSEMLANTCGWVRSEETDLRGLSVHHWTLSRGGLEDCMTDLEFDDFRGLTEVTGDLYLASAGNYVVQMDLVFRGKGIDMSLEPGQPLPVDGLMEFHYEIYDVNQPIAIQVPDEALASGVTPDDLPIPENAEAVNNMFGVITFVSAIEPKDLAEFYGSELPELGWSQLSTEEFGGLYLLEYVKDGRQISIMIEIDDDIGKSAVLISIQDAE